MTAVAAATRITPKVDKSKTTTGASVAKHDLRFGEILRDALIERDITTGTGNANWAAFAEMLDGVHYETLRKAVVGDRVPTPLLMEQVAQVLDFDPHVFPEYRLWETQRLFDPREVGMDEALSNLQRFIERGESKARKR